MAVGTDSERYRDLKPLGSGGMGHVTLGEDCLLGRQVALKRLHSGHDVNAISRLRREALIGASVNHPNLVSIYDVLTEADGGVVVVMEYVPGRTLAAALAGSGGLPPQEAMRILEGVAAGLDAIHARGIVHRDVKPPNVLLGDDGAVKLGDLGIAAVTDGTRITSAGTVLGSWRYMAPEQLEGERSSPALDIYALAAVAYEALSGHAARREQNPMALAHAIATRPPPDIRNDWAAAPPAVAEVLSQGMSRDPAARPASAGRLVERLAEALQPARPARAVRPAPVAVAATRAAPPAPAPSPAAAPARLEPAAVSGPPGRRRTGPWLALLLGLVLAVVAAIVIAGGSGGTSAPQTASRTTATHRQSATASTHSAARSSTTTASAAPVTQPASTSTPTAPAKSSGPAAAGPAAGGPAAGPGKSTSGADAPASAVQRFYTLAAAHDYAAAWALADPAFQSQLGGYASFQSGQAGDRSITFNSLNTAGQHGKTATVALSTTSVRTDGTRQCSGTADVVRSPGDTWLVHQIHINCS